MHGAYFLYKRNFKSGIIWYYRAYKPDGTLATGKSTGCHSKMKARAFCDDLLQKGILYGGSNLLFGYYANKWFDDGSPWLEDKMSEGTPERPALSLSTIIQYRQTLAKHILPFFAKYKLCDIKPSNVKHFRTELIQSKGLSRKTVNNIVGVLRIITDYALADNILMFDPLRGIRPLKSDADTRDGFTYDEAVKIFNSEWESPVFKLISITAAVTGMRISEIFAISKKTLTEKYIDVSKQIYRGVLCPCKTKEKRKVPIPKKLYTALKNELNRTSEEFCFGKVSGTVVMRQLKKVLNNLGMEEERKQRGLCTHSWRHFFNTYLLANNVTEIKVKAVMGHSSGKGSMTERYTNWKPDMFPEVYSLQEKLVDVFMKE